MKEVQFSGRGIMQITPQCQALMPFALDAVLKRMRTELYDKLASCFPQSMAQPKDNLVDLIKLK